MLLSKKRNKKGTKGKRWLSGIQRSSCDFQAFDGGSCEFVEFRLGNLLLLLLLSKGL